MTSAAPAVTRRPARTRAGRSPPADRRARCCRRRLWYLILLVAPIAIVVLFSFGDAQRERRLRTGGSRSTTTPPPQPSPDPFITSLMLAIARDAAVPAGRAAAGVLHRDPCGAPQGPVHRPAGHPVLDELPDPHLCVAADPRARTGSPGFIADIVRQSQRFRILGTEFGVLHRPRLRLPAADGLPALRDARADGPDARRGVEGPRRRAAGRRSGRSRCRSRCPA